MASSGCREELPPKTYGDDAPEAQAFAPLPSADPRDSLKGRRMLLVHSYHQGYPAEYTLRILRGASPQALPEAKSTRGIKMLNLDTARRLGIVVGREMAGDVVFVKE